MQTSIATTGRRSSRALMLAAAFLLVLATATASQWRTMQSMVNTCDTAHDRLEQMREDAAQILALRHAPQTATGRTRSSQELLAQVQAAIKAAGIDSTRWHDSVPQPPRRIGSTDYKLVSTRLYFEGLTLRKLAAFVQHLESSDPTLQITSVNLSEEGRDSATYDVDLAVSYTVYAPRVGHGG